ncbi:MAG: tetratricopeptide repeat protein [Burkholderiaceae bacterium]|jgi:regulator of sirC expression with transglutaminase-like and TPR domain|nr:tetratricopeptide repeat protein [Aquabacterium sp.]NUP86978.1 tetratricopeptide repeat protein [Burkholderiaceae bacterium]
MSTLPLRAPTPLEYFAALVAEDDGFALFEAAVAAAQDEYPALDTQAVLDEVDALGARLKARLPADAPPMHRLRALNRYFFNELGFGGNVNDYYDRRNSYLNDVLSTRRGIPITLALLYAELAGQLGLVARGVAFPGHFLVKLRLPQGEVIVDPFNGRSLSRDELDERLAPYRRQHGLEGDDDVPLGLFLQAADPRDVIARLLRNLKEIHRSAEDWERLLAVMNRLVVLLPAVPQELRDRGLVHAELGSSHEALVDLGDYLRRCPDADDAVALRERVRELQRGRPAAWH